MAAGTGKVQRAPRTSEIPQPFLTTCPPPPPHIPACWSGLARSGSPRQELCRTGRPVLLSNHHLPAVPGVSRNPWRGQQEECPVHSPAPEPRLPPCQQPAQFKGKVESQAPVRCSHIQRWPRGEGKQGHLLSDRAGSLGTGQ